MQRLGLHLTVSGWLIPNASSLTTEQINDVRQVAATAGMTIETRSDAPTLATVLDWATVAGMLLALGILAMSVGLIRGEPAEGLRTLAAVGADSRIRRGITGATAGALGLTGAVIGTAAAYLAAIAWFRASHLESLSALTAVPVANLLIILIGMPLAGAAGGWLSAGREPPAIAHRPME